MKNVLIITYCFPPLNVIASRRYGELTPFMEENGWRPWVLTMNSTGDLPVQIPQEQCIRVDDHPQQTLRIEDMNQEAYRMPTILETARTITSKANIRFQSFDRTVLKWYLRIKKNANYIASSIPKPDVIIGSFGPAASLWAAKLFASRFNVSWVADFRDLGALDRMDRPMLCHKLDLLIEKRLLSTAKALITVSEHLSDIIKTEYKKPSRCIYNGWTDMPLPATLERSKFDESYLYYAGRFCPQRIDSVNMLMDCVKEINGLTLKFRSLGPRDLEERVIDYAVSIGIRDSVELLEAAGQETVAKEAELASANVVFEDLDTSNPYSAGTLTGKFLQLLTYSPPILAIARKDSEIGTILKDTKKGNICSSKEQITSFLNSIIRKEKKWDGNPNIEKYSKRRQAKKLCAFLDELIIDLPRN